MNKIISKKALPIIFTMMALNSICIADSDTDYHPSAKRGAGAWADHCARCHLLRRTDEFTDNQWSVVMSHMRIRANLTGEETADILEFLQKSNSRD